MRTPARWTRKRRRAGAKRAAPAVRAQRSAGTGPARRVPRALSLRRVAIVSSAVLLAGGIGLVIALAPGWGRGAEEFRVERVDVRGTVVLTTAEVQALCGLTEGESLLGVDVPEVERAVMRSPRVERAQAMRLLPDRVLIRLVERSPLALVDTASGTVEVSDDLIVLPRAERSAFVDLPVVTGLECELVAGERVDNEQLAAALGTLERARRVSHELWMEMSELRIAPGSGLVIYTVADGAEIRVGSGALNESTLERLAMVLQDVRESGSRAESIDLRFEDQAVVRLTPGGAAGRV